MDMMEHKDQLEEDVQILETYIAQSTVKINMGIDVEAIEDTLERYQTAPDQEIKKEELDQLYVMVTSMKNELEEDLSELDLRYLEQLREMIDDCSCQQARQVSSFLPFDDYQQEQEQEQEYEYEQDEQYNSPPKTNAPKQRLQERIKISHNTKIVKLPRRKRFNKNQYIIPKHPYDWSGLEPDQHNNEQQEIWYMDNENIDC